MRNTGYLLLTVTMLVLMHLTIIKCMQWHLPQSQIQKPISIIGVIDSIPVQKFHGKQFQFFAEKINHQKVSTRFLIAWYQHAPKLTIGQRWKFTVKLKPPIGSHNPGGFDYAAYLTSQGITGTGYVDAREKQQLLGVDHTYFIARFREKIQSEISRVIHDHAIAAFISALCVGLRNGLTESDWQVFQKTGTNHLVAIAGLHIGFVATLFYFITNRLWRLSQKLMLWMPATRAASIIALISALCYTALSGFAIPAQRASIMLFFLLIGNIVGLRLSIWCRLFFAGCIILILYPRDLFDSSFWLSFISIGILSWVLTGRLQSQHGINSHMKMQAAILIGLLPLMLLFFQQISLIAFFTNMIAIPWVGFVILPISIAACMMNLCHFIFVSKKLFWFAGVCLKPLWHFLVFSSHFSFASWHHAIISQFILLSAIIGTIFLLSPRGTPAKYIGCFGLLPLFFYHPSSLKQNDFKVTVIDVGQGLSVLVQTAHHNLLYDTGAHFPHGFDYGESVVAPYLRLQNIETINRLEISHGDNDHSGGVASIVKDFQVQSIFTSAPKLIQEFHGQHCFAGQQWTWDHVHFSTLNPKKNRPYEDNDSSCVIKISNGKTQILLTGDIQKNTEYKLVDQYGSQLKSTVLLVPHHGSKTSSSRLFLKTVSPHYAIISAGKLNRYHLPAATIVSRYAKYHIKLYNTADSGAIIVRFFKNGKVKLRATVNR